MQCDSHRTLKAIAYCPPQPLNGDDPLYSIDKGKPGRHNSTLLQAESLRLGNW
ncbi:MULTISPECIES: hypothetical protein [Nostocales]|uniref:Uncharacterized protein n=3 Tax=Nostocales TaxID=1161 RepID=A0A8S9SWJ3_9CYAN|nr:hypothetical protein [Tolypothrix bouteillei]KAF3884226.1 hypothetical protein DA73_0400000990 [Tolypothrix bouteillei VB521301]